MTTETEYTQVIEDTALIIQYDPYRFNASASRGWESSYTDGNSPTADGLWLLGQGDSRHVTSRVGSTLQFSFHGHGIDLVGLPGGFAYDVILDGSSVGTGNAGGGILASLRNLEDKTHTIQIVVGESDGTTDALFVFDKALLLIGSGYSNAIVSSENIDDNDQRLTYTGQGWQRATSPYLIASDVGVHQTRTNGDSVTFEFEGISIYLAGNSNGDCSTYNVALDDQPPVTYDSRTLQFIGDNTFFFASGLDPNVKHRITVTNLANNLLELDYFSAKKVDAGTQTTSNATSATSTNTASASAQAANSDGKRTNIAAIAGGVAGAIVLAVAATMVVFLFKKRNMRKRQEAAENERLARHAGMRLSLPATPAVTRPAVNPEMYTPPATSSYPPNPVAQTPQRTDFRW
ncbi:hypothetical protein FRC03_010415 [Tulasnella sp. 419]|nr:hypothetical protein FRC03_010415 [Tulasnella sp. 419]